MLLFHEEKHKEKWFRCFPASKRAYTPTNTLEHFNGATVSNLPHRKLRGKWLYIILLALYSQFEQKFSSRLCFSVVSISRAPLLRVAHTVSHLRFYSSLNCTINAVMMILPLYRRQHCTASPFCASNAEADDDETEGKTSL